jgi:predicted CXXCH cytochrome family protein
LFGTGRLVTVCIVIAGAVVPFAAVASDRQVAEHPPLVDARRTKCEVCHADKRDGKVFHAVVDDCQACHEFSKIDGKSTVRLTEHEPALCIACHGELEREAAGAVAAPHLPVTDGCLTCHEPHASPNDGLLKTRMPELCISCHDADGLRSGHGVSVARSNCATCHPAHGSDVGGMLAAGTQHAPYSGRNCEACHRRGLSTRARENASKVCFACHAADPFEATVVHAVVRRGECLACHDPHSSSNAALARLTGQELCFSCHGEIAARLEGRTVHAVVDGSCETCHLTHAGAHAGLLVDAVPGICASCHEIDDEALVTRHLGADLAKADCVACHEAHGSRLDGLFADQSVHSPFAERACATCHDDGASKLVAGGGRALCLACHADVESAVASAAHPHAALDMAECSDCHSAHVSRNRKLQKGRRSEICFGCHEDVRAEQGEFQHGAIAILGCEACHEAHGGSLPKMIRAGADDLCLGCHDRGRWKEHASGSASVLLDRFEFSARSAERIPTLALTDGATGHPVAGHRALGAITEAERASSRSRATFDGEFHCLTCHDPHKGSVRELIVEGKTEICSRCHQT